MELNSEAVLDQLNDFVERDYEITPVLEEYLQKIAKTGNILYPWSKLKPLLIHKMELVMLEFSRNCPCIPSYPNTDPFDYDRLKTSILEAVDNFPNAPFTIQRLCELITNPKKHYNRTDKYMRGLEKNLLVVSTVEPNGSSSGDRETESHNDWINNDSSNEEHSYSDAANNASPTVNGTVLENFATVFPSATRLANPANNIQVAIVSDTSAYQQHSGSLDYDMGNHIDEPKDDEMHYENGIDSNDNMDMIMSAGSSDSISPLSSTEQPIEVKNESQFLPESSASLVEEKIDLPEESPMEKDKEEPLVQNSDDETENKSSSDCNVQPEKTIDTLSEKSDTPNEQSDSKICDTIMEDVYKAIDDDDDEMKSPETKLDENDFTCEVESPKTLYSESDCCEPEVKRRKLETDDTNETNDQLVPEKESVETEVLSSNSANLEHDTISSDTESQPVQISVPEPDEPCEESSTMIA